MMLSVRGLAMAAVVIAACGTANAQNLLVNGGFETGVYGLEPTYGVGYWNGDTGSFTTTENGITPYEGQRMFRALDIAHGQFSDVWQLVDLTAYRTWVATGTQTFSLSAWFNRVAGNSQTNTQYRTTIMAYDGSPSEFPDRPFLLKASDVYRTSDSLATTWEMSSVNAVLPADTLWVACGFRWVANNQPLVFEGHYVDDVRATVTPEPATLSLLALGGLLALRRRR
jgi:hypothetical protein